MKKKPLSEHRKNSSSNDDSPTQSSFVHQIKKMAELALNENETINDNILAQIPASVYWMNKDFVYLGCTDSMAELLQLESRHSIVGKSYSELFDEKSASYYRKTDKSVIETGISANIEEPLYFPDGSERIYLSHKAPLYDAQKNIIGMIAISTDITKLKRMEKELKIAKEKAEAADKAKAEFIANMSHDIRTPLTGIIGLSSMVESESHEDEIKEYAHMLNISGEQLLSLLNSVLDIVASDTIGHKALRLSTFSLEDLLHSIFELELPSLQLKSIDFKLDMDESLSKFVESDKEKIYRIVLNILSNAIKFTHDGSITIKACKLNQTNDEVITKIQIIDTGIGIPKEDISKVFDQFYRANPAHEGKFDGYGVGLHIVQKYLKLLKGEVLVESEVGKGTCISLTLPLKKASQPESYIKPPHAVKDDKSSAKPQENLNAKPEPIENARAKVLLVEDNMIARMVAKNMLTKEKCQVLEAENSTDAFELFIHNDFDFVLTDIGLPDYSGLELAKKMRQFQIEKNCGRTPVIVLSGHEDTENLPTYEFKYGLAGMYTKPLRVEELTEILEIYGNNNETPETVNQTSANQTSNTNNHLLDEALAIKQLGSIEMVREMAQMMLDDAFVNMIPEIDKCYQACDWDAFKKEVHKFKSSCLYCATTKLLKLTQSLESLADTKDINQIEPIYQKFSHCVISTEQYIESWLSIKQE